MPLPGPKTYRRLILLTLFEIMGCLFWGGRALGGNWADHKISIVSKHAKYGAIEHKLNELIKEKQRTKDPEHAKKLIKEITKQYDELTKAYNSHKEEQVHMRFMHPEQDDSEGRKYTDKKPRSLKELNTTIGLDNQLTLLRKKVEKIYNPPPELIRPGQDRIPAATTPPPEEPKKKSGLKLVF